MRSADRRDFEEYVSTRLPALHRAAYLLCGDADRADDIVQNTVTKLYRRWRIAREAENLDGYVHRILTRTFIDEKRLSWSRVRLMGRPWGSQEANQWGMSGTVPGNPPQDQVDERRSVVDALRRLAPGQRAVIVLRFLCDMSVEEVATTLGCSEGTVKSQTSRGLVVLRAFFADDSDPTSTEPACAI